VDEKFEMLGGIAGQRRSHCRGDASFLSVPARERSEIDGFVGDVEVFGIHRAVGHAAKGREQRAEPGITEAVFLDRVKRGVVRSRRSGRKVETWLAENGERFQSRVRC